MIRKVMCKLAFILDRIKNKILDVFGKRVEFAPGFFFSATVILHAFEKNGEISIEIIDPYFEDLTYQKIAGFDIQTVQLQNGEVKKVILKF